MPILQVLMGLVCIGVLAWLVNRFVPMQDDIKRIFIAVVVIGTVVWLLFVFGFIDALTNVRVPRAG